MFKVLILIKRKPGMSIEDFRRHYEENHAPLAMRMVPNLKRYVRHYAAPYPDAASMPDIPCDVITEFGFDDRADFERGMAYIQDPERSPILVEDEERFIDRDSVRFFMIEDCETVIPG